MNIGKLNLTIYESLGYLDLIVFVKSPAACVFRVCSIPQKYYEDTKKLMEVKTLLTKVSYLEKDGVYYVKINTWDELIGIIDLFHDRGIPATVAEDDASERDRWGWPLPELIVKSN